MPTIIETTVYTYEELSERAKETAREWYAQCIMEDTYWSEAVLEDAVRIGELLGITFHGKNPERNFSWDIDRGSFVSFDGTYSYRKGSVRLIASEAPANADSPDNQEINRIAQALYDAQRKAFYRITAACCSCRDWMDVSADEDNEDVEQALKDFADWILTSLRAEYEYCMSEEYLREGIEANEYTFTENGRRAG